MRGIGILFRVAFWLYVTLCAGALAIGVVGVLGDPSEPLSMVFAIALALPWSLIVGSPPGISGPVGSAVMLALFMALNAAALWFVSRGALRRGLR